MMCRSHGKRVLCRLWAVVGFTVFVTGLNRANGAITVPSGFDLLTTAAGTSFDVDGPGGPLPAIALLGVSLGTFDFGSGPVAVNTTDTIVKRTAAATGPGVDAVPIEMLALQLVSVAPVPLAPFGGVGTDFIGVTLSSDRGRHGTDPAAGAFSTGSMAIDFDTGTFTSSILLSFDVREGGIAGPILPFGLDLVKLLANPSPAPWADSFQMGLDRLEVIEESSNIPLFTLHRFTATPDFGGGIPGGPPLIIPGVNDMFIVGVSSVPEPAAVSIWLGLGLVTGVGYLRRRQGARLVSR